MKIQIELSEETAKRLSIMAIENDTVRKLYIQELLTDHAKS